MAPILSRNLFATQHMVTIRLPLSFEQALKMSKAEWATFADACREAVNARNTRTWASNVVFPARRRAQAIHRRVRGGRYPGVHWRLQ